MNEIDFLRPKVHIPGETDSICNQKQPGTRPPSSEKIIKDIRRSPTNQEFSLFSRKIEIIVKYIIRNIVFNI